MEEDYSNENLDESDENSGVCQECEMYQKRIYELNAKLRENLSENEYKMTKQRLDDLVQAQLVHQRKHF